MGPAWADYTLNMHKGVTDISHRIYHLHMAIFIICVIVGIIVFGVMFYAIIYHRKSRGAQAANFHESTVVEIIWTLIPFLILIGMAVPATETLIKMYETEESDITIKITGHQWFWEYEYIGKNVRFMSNLLTSQDQIKNRDVKNPHYLLEVNNPLVVPVKKRIRFLATSADVVHSWWVPMLGIKKDSIPGFINEAWAVIDEPGIYRGQCAELCGANHGFMPIVVEAKSEEEYNAWLNQKICNQQKPKEQPHQEQTEKTQVQKVEPTKQQPPPTASTTEHPPAKTEKAEGKT